MSIEAIEETFAALTGDLNRGLNCDVHEEEHRAWWFFESRCPACAWESTTALCDTQYYQTIANKEKKILKCPSCHNSFKPFDYIEKTRRMN